MKILSVFLAVCLWLGTTLGIARADFPILNPNQTPFPRASLADFSDLVPAPSGQKGFLQVKGDHFYWADGTRAKFWGINVANTSLQESDANIEAMIKNFRASGFNLVRLHHFDERGGIIDLTKDDSRHFDEAKWKKLDFWIAKARENGLYVYLDLLDYRRFKEGDGVKNAEAIGRSAKPYAIFDRKLIDLQKEYARALMQHVNSVNGIRYVDDPTITMLEIYDENGLFMRRGLWRSMPEPYATEFQAQWNDWLKGKYGSTANLVRAWTTLDGQSALLPDESLENGSVGLPAMTWTPNQLKAEDKPYAASARKFDGARFAYDLHRRYFSEMKSFLRNEVGVKIPLCATGRYDDLPDLASQSAELDFIGCNFYYDHPYWGSGLPAWQLPSYYHGRSPISDVGEMSMAATLGLSRVRGKPFVVREWNYCWPNRYRAEGMLEAASFGAFHDIDAMILFVYETNPSAQVGYFNVRSDPARWGMAAMGSRIFLGNLLQTSRNHVVLPYNIIDLFTYEKPHQPLYNLGWTSDVANDFFDGVTYNAPRGTTLMVPPGRSAPGNYVGAPALLYGRDLRSDGAGDMTDFPTWAQNLGLTMRQTQGTSFSYNGLLYDPQTNNQTTRTRVFDLNTVRGQGWTPVGENEAENAAHGFWNSASKTLGFSELGRDEVLGAALDALQLAAGGPSNHVNAATSIFRADTGQWARNSPTGRFSVISPQVQILAGNLKNVQGFAGGMRVKNAVSGGLVALSLDGLPLVKSRRYMIKMGADTRNADEGTGRDPRFLAQKTGQWMVKSFGKGAVQANAVVTANPLEISLDKRPLLRVGSTGVNFELLVENGRATFWCDTPGTRFELLNSRGQALPCRLINGDKRGPLLNTPIFPAGALAVRSE